MNNTRHFFRYVGFSFLALFVSGGGDLCAGTGAMSQMALPADVSAKRTATTESWTIVSNPEVNLVTSRGEAVPATGEVLVFSNANGGFVRRLRSPLPYPYAYMGRCLAAAGDIVVVTDGDFTVRAFNCATGAQVWRTNLLPSQYINGISTDGARVILGITETLFVTTIVLDAVTGAGLGAPSWNANGMDYFPGDAVAVNGGWIAVGSPRSQVSGVLGVVHVMRSNGTSDTLGPPEAITGISYGTSVAISGTSLYVGSPANRKVYHYDLRTLTLLEAIQPPSANFSTFGSKLAASGHLLLILGADGPWLFDRQTGALNTIFWNPVGPNTRVVDGLSICGPYAAAPAHGKAVRAVGVSGGRFDGDIVAVTGGVAGGASGAKFSSFADATLTSTGEVRFCARLTGSGVSAATDVGLWSGAMGVNSLLLREGTVSGSIKAGTLFRPFTSVNGAAEYTLSRSSSGAVSLWKRNGSTLAPHLLPGGSIFLLGEPNPVTVGKLHNASGTTSTTIANISLKQGGNVNATNDSVMTRPGLFSIVDEREGLASGLTNALHAQLNPRVASAGNRIAYSSFLTGRLTTANAAVFTKVLDGSKVVAMEKGQPPLGTFEQFPDAKLSSFIGEGVSAAVTVIRGTYKTAKFSAEGLWSYNHGTAAKHSVAWVRGQVPGLATGIKWVRFLKTFATTDGTTLFLAQITGPGVNSRNDVGLWRCSLGSNAPKLLVREGDALVGGGRTIISTIQQVDAGSDGSWTLLASLSRCPTAHNQVLLGGSVSVDSGYSIVMRKGNAVDGTVTSAKLLSISLPSNHTNAAGMGSIGQGRIVENGRILHRATFKHGTELALTDIWGY